MNNKLNNYGVSTVIAIDDIFNKPKSTDLLTEFKLDIIEDLTGDYDRYREYTVDEYIEETGENDFIEKLYETAINSNSYKWLEDEGVEVHKIGADISEVQKQLENIDSSDKSRKNLVILDRVLQPTVYGVENNELLTSILNIVGQSLTDKNLLLLIYTDNEIPAELDTFDGVKSYLKNQLKVEEKLIDQIALHFNYVKKTSELSSDFFDNILKSQKANYIQEYTNIFEESYAKLAERLWELNRNPVLFYYDYLNEGQHADDIMYDTFVSKFNQVYSKTFGQNGKYSDLINPIRRSMREHLVEVTGADLNIYRNLKEFEIALHNEENLLEISDSSDISFGDVLQIGEKFYMIMSQDCDIALRNNGKRKLKFIQLVGLELKKEVISEQYLFETFKTQKLLNKVNFIEGMVRFGIPKEILNKVKMSDAKESLSADQIDSLEINMGFEASPKTLITVDSVWLDCLTLRKNNDYIELTETNLQNSHEIRIATKKHLENCLMSLREQLNDNDKEIIDKIIQFSLSNTGISIESLFTQEGLEGFKISNIKRIGRLNRLDAMKILKTVLDDESRIPTIDNLLI
ncbi:hypothetical protein C6A33_00930 [Streptococcus anginosus]|uniref:hypothetical protein n=1 Tax=Streptococcus anginosus TaxID=1328 RepID=UPI000D028AAB|nr:hypothetical protein [Streptococcus anginosus]MCY7232919.1 hypothetical protein [Streptococcus anginosus]PRT63838.1 hypothetical protein C6A33_00930 [Streptococcus anginosus]